MFASLPPLSLKREDLHELFSSYGMVVRARVWRDLETFESHGFGFVEMGNEDDARDAINALDREWWRGRRLKVSLARPRARM
jgi:cold-inducible RNA-binding protein